MIRVKLLLLIGLVGGSTTAFVPRLFQPSATVSHNERRKSSVLLHMSQFDVSKPTFDLFSLRSVRGDALTKYNSLNQSEPLRINLFGLLALTFFASPWLAQELNNNSSDMLSLPVIAVAMVAGVGSTGLFVRECQRRSKQLTRMEKELNALGLTLRLPSNPLADAPFQTAQPLAQLMNKSARAVRLLALSGTAEQLKSALLPLQVLQRRLVQASTYVVVIPTDGSSSDDWGLDSNQRNGFLADAGNTNDWKEYFDSLAVAASSEDGSSEFRWFGISAIGRSFGSGKGEVPEWLQILGQHLRPTDILLDETDPSQDDVDGVLAQQKTFYDALREGKLDEMKQVCSTQPANQVSAVMEEGGRLDEWKTCLEEGARPAGMKLGDADVMVVSDTDFPLLRVSTRQPCWRYKAGLEQMPKGNGN
ncbi:expressed unknown protein [Seminavis robusta]|uniref:Uncharacterized protein n=1 Tax=Seminavis robusta TaxID=568900 RepID=A0A9N8E4E8_9STRA|nr:expressed unknown protein [Seminavis robusta]|eukprot:Sro654_g182020.1 n/a (419) ;mRNA; r:16641-17897